MDSALSSLSTTSSREATAPHNSMPPTTTTTTTTTKKKTVRFGPTEDATVDVTQLGPLLPCCSEMSPKDKMELWWSKHELGLMARGAKLIAKGIRTRSYRKSNKISSYARVVRQIYTECSEKGSVTSRTTSRHLQQWHSVGHSRRGLELFSVPIPERVGAMKSVIGHVVNMQHYLNEKQIHDYNNRVQLIRTASLCYSQVARVFALAMAKADAMAALDEYQTPPVMYQVVDMCGNKLVSKTAQSDDARSPHQVKLHQSKRTGNGTRRQRPQQIVTAASYSHSRRRSGS